MPVILGKFQENSRRLRQLSVIKKTQKFSKIGKIDKKLLKSSKNCYTGNIFKAAENEPRKASIGRAESGFSVFATVGTLVCRSAALSPISIYSRIRFDRAVFVALCLWLCMFLRFYACGAVCCQGFLLLLVALINRYRCYGVMLMALRAFCAFMFAVYGSLYFCAVGVACRCGVMFLLLSFSAASGF